MAGPSSSSLIFCFFVFFFYHQRRTFTIKGYPVKDGGRGDEIRIWKLAALKLKYGHTYIVLRYTRYR